jgi:hypothetical protein
MLPYTEIIITLTRHQLDLERPISASYDCPFKGLPSLLPPFGLQFSIPFDILLLFILVTCRSKFDLYLLSFLSTDSESTIPKFLHSFCGHQECTGLFFWKISSALFFIIKPTRCTNFINLFWHETLHVSDNSSVHHQEFIYCALSNGMCHTGL